MDLGQTFFSYRKMSGLASFFTGDASYFWFSIPVMFFIYNDYRHFPDIDSDRKSGESEITESAVQTEGKTVGQDKQDEPADDKDNGQKEEMQDDNVPHPSLIGQTTSVDSVVPVVNKAEGQMTSVDSVDPAVNKPEDVVVQVYIPKYLSDEFKDGLLQRLEDKETSLKLKFETRNGVQSVVRHQPLLIFCINSSRLGTDTEKSVKEVEKVTDQNQSVLIVFIHKDLHALPSQSSSRILTGPEFRHLYGIYDIACVTGKGVYDCSMNTDSVSKILNFIREYQSNQ